MTEKPQLIYEPEILDLSQASDKRRYEELLKIPGISISDEIEGQIIELFKCRHVQLSDTEHPEAYLRFKDDLISGHKDVHTYGLWIFYSWSNRLVHSLTQEAFVEVRTSRNKYKITQEEQDLLATKTIGVVGLSVGQSVALTLAMERIGGVLRLADFDILELSNLNRIRTPISNLGVPKALVVAREILEIDPFIKVEIFSDGLTRENKISFFGTDRPLDLIIDECDSVDIKYMLRFEARNRKIPVLMEMSDRCMVDVERFDLEPNRPVLHGLVGDVDMEVLSKLKTSEEKIPYMVPMLGLETLSPRLRASALEIGHTISTWPQLASAVMMGGGVTADVARRIFLNEIVESGRSYVDLEEIFPGENKTLGVSHLSNSDFQKLSESNTPKSSDLSNLESEMVQILKAACHAPSGGNLQPWLWKPFSNRIELFMNPNRQSSFLDYDNVATYLALGTSIENASLCAKNLGYSVQFNFDFETEFNKIGTLVLNKTNDLVNEKDFFLNENLFKRETNRRTESEIEPLTAIEKDGLYASINNGSTLILFESTEEIQVLAEIISSTEKFRLLNNEGHANFIDEMRWTEEQALQTGDGIDIRTLDIKDSEKIGIQMARDPKVIKLLKNWKLGSVFKNVSEKGALTASAIGVLCLEHVNTPIDFIRVGRDLERLWIQANAVNLAFQPQSPITLISHQLRNPNANMSNEEKRELMHLYTNLKNIIETRGKYEPVFIFRLFRTEKTVIRSYRRSLKDQVI